MDRYMAAFKEFKKKLQNGYNTDDGKVVTQKVEDNQSNNNKKTQMISHI